MVLMGSRFAEMFKRRPFKTAFCLYWLPARKLQQHNFNFRLKLLKSYGYTPSQLLDTGITATKLKNSKVFQVPDFRNDGVPLKDFQSAFSISQLLYHGCRIRDLLAFPSRLDHLIEEGGKRLSQDLPQEEREEWTKVFIDFKKTQTWENCVHIVQLRFGMTSFQSLSCCKLAKRWMHSGMSIRLNVRRLGDFQSRMQ